MSETEITIDEKIEQVIIESKSIKLLCLMITRFMEWVIEIL